MSKIYIESIVKISTSYLNISITDNGHHCYETTMVLMGENFTFPYRDKVFYIDDNTKTKVVVSINFRDKIKKESHIGIVDLIDHRKNDPSQTESVEIAAAIYMTLSSSMFHQFSLWEGKAIKFIAIPYILPKPIDLGKGHSTVAYVKSVLFDIKHQSQS